MAKKEQIEIPGYKNYRNDDTENSKRIVVALRNSIKTISVEVSTYDEVGQIRVVLVHDTRSNDSRSNDARFVHKLYLSLHAINTLAGEDTAYIALKS